MLGKSLPSSFFERPTLRVAKDLLGKYLARKIGRTIVARRITEVEAYDGFQDKASHAHHGLTKRNFPMFGRAGRWYVYFTYGMHWMLNIVTGKKNYPAAILIRGVDGINGPARLTKFFKIDKAASRRINNLPANRKSGLWIEDRPIIHNSKFIIRATPRIGVAYAGPIWSKKRWRFFLEIR